MLSLGGCLSSCYVGPEYVVKLKDASKVSEYHPGASDSEQREDTITSGLTQSFAGVWVGTDLAEVSPIPTENKGTFGWTLNAEAGHGGYYSGGFYHASTQYQSSHRVVIPVPEIQEIRKQSRWGATIGANLVFLSFVPFMYGLVRLEHKGEVTQDDRRVGIPCMIIGGGGMIGGTVLYFWDSFSPIAAPRIVYSAPLFPPGPPGPPRPPEQ